VGEGESGAVARQRARGKLAIREALRATNKRKSVICATGKRSRKTEESYILKRGKRVRVAGW